MERQCLLFLQQRTLTQQGLGPLCAINGLMHRSIATSFNHLVGEQKQGRRNFEAGRFGDLQAEDKQIVPRLLERQF
jgi:hypothetical protein